MKISTNSLRFLNQHYGSAGDPTVEGVEKLVEKIGAQLGAVEEVVPFGDKYQGVVIARVVTSDQHPNADRLHVCKVDDGGKVEGLERDENGHIQVVCGAPNVRAGMLVAWLPPGSIVPSTFYDVDQFKLDERELRGVMSNGMMASPKELALGDSHEGILEITDEHQPGTLFIDAYGLRDDKIIDMENKMFTHRPDCFGYLGIAREIEGIHGRAYKSPDWYKLDPEIPAVETEELKLEVRNELPESVPRFTAVTLRDIEVKESPVWLQVELARAGIRPINNIVDYTNFFMLETGQPLHAYDYDKVAGLSDADRAVITVRNAKLNEKITLLGGKQVSLTPQNIVIATDKQPIGLGGVMGGAETEVGMQTRNIIIECANFDMYNIRRTSMALGLFTDAVTRFTKGQSPLQNKAVIAKIVDEIRQYADGKVASALIDDNHIDAISMQRGSLEAPVEIGRDFINQRLGLGLSTQQMARLLQNVEFAVEEQGDVLTITAPFWRTDIALPEDIVEEIGRLYGYDHLPLELPERSINPAQKDEILQLKARIRQQFAALGANEVLSYSFVHGDLFKKVGQDAGQAFQLANALSPDLQYYRLSLTPSLLDKVHANIKAGYNDFAMFEMGKVHVKSVLDDQSLPKESSRFSFVFAADDKTATKNYAGAPYYQALKYLDGITQLPLDIVYVPLIDFKTDDLAIQQLVKPFEPGRTAILQYEGKVLGVVGEYRASVRKSLKLPAFVAGFELLVDELRTNTALTYYQLPRFPKVEQDICLKVNEGLPYKELFDFVWSHLNENRPDRTFHSLSPVDIYQRDDDKSHKQITFRLELASYERTLTDQEVNSLLDRVAEAAQQKFGAERI
jgi:phenylalanyl-tRNA synthetase beta chain